MVVSHLLRGIVSLSCWGGSVPSGWRCRYGLLVGVSVCWGSEVWVEWQTCVTLLSSSSWLHVKWDFCLLMFTSSRVRMSKTQFPACCLSSVRNAHFRPWVGSSFGWRIFPTQWCPACGPGQLWMQSNTNSWVYLKSFFGSSAFVSVCVFNVWPKTTPLWLRDAKRLDTSTPWLRVWFLVREHTRINQWMHN